MAELKCGISEYLNEFDGFSAVIKQRYSDFHVHEVSPSNGLATLTTPLVEPKGLTPAEDADVKADFNSLLEAVKPSGMTSDHVDSLIGLQRNEVNTLEIKCSELDKDARQKIHQFVRENCKGLETKTENKGDNGTSIKVFKRNSGQARKRKHWDTERPNYLKFVIYKENKDSSVACSIIGKQIGLRAQDFGVAGTKDKRAITCQFATLYRVDADRLITANRSLRGMRVAECSYVENELKLGDLRGNRFSIVLRNVDKSESKIKPMLEKWKKSGFINYYGLQRFGTTSVGTHEVGKLLLCSKWKEACDLFLSVRDYEDDLNEARRIWRDTGDPNSALDAAKLSRMHSSIETSLLHGLVKHARTNDYLAAFNFVNRNMRLLFPHSYQSLIWNKVVSKRIQNFGRKVKVGDLVAMTTDDSLDGEKVTKEMVHVVTEDDVTENKYCKLDLILPLPGHDVLFPENEVKTYYDEFLSADDLTMECFKNNVKDFSLPGSYRKLFVDFDKDMKYWFMKYNDPNKPLILSDMEKLKGEKDPVSLEDGDSLAVCLQFILPSSCYATMALRELLRIDTSAAFHSTLNQKKDLVKVIE